MARQPERAYARSTRLGRGGLQVRGEAADLPAYGRVKPSYDVHRNAGHPLDTSSVEASARQR